ncbi:ABC transporter permease [Demequina phytophila]|uniref:ABC transporter permease n=1 Tax=Demequina phytophila TaxID=1638981 RepID=UPI000784E075|nr:ABC transporter permease [Demequina phytophila]
MRFILRRMAFYLFTAWAAITINFFLPRLMKGDPISAYLARNQGKVSPESIESLTTLFGLDSDKSMLQQYLDYWGLLFSGDLGVSISNGLAPVSAVIASALPWTLGLVGIATVLSFLIGTSLGSVIGWRRGSRADWAVPFATFFSTVPYFWMGLIVIAVFSTTLGWFPASHAYDKGSQPEWSWDFIGQVIAHGTLPALTIVVASLGGWVLGMRNMMITVLDEDYVTVAQAKGLRQRRVLTHYASRNAVLPQLSSFALALGFIVGGTLVMELVFSYPGVGKLLLDATSAKDYPLMQGLFLVITLAVLVANILADVAYAALDPRTRQMES